MNARDMAVEAAGADLALARHTRDSLPVDEAARLAYQPGGPSVAELERRIRARRRLAEPTEPKPQIGRPLGPSRAAS